MSLVDTMGASQFTMRRLGSTLGVEAMSVYRYYPSRRAVLDAVVDAVSTRALAAPVTDLGTGDGWRVFLRTVAHDQRQLALTHPELFLLTAWHPTDEPWLRPPLRTVQQTDAFASTLAACQFPPAAVAAAYRQFNAFLLGHLLGATTQNASSASVSVRGSGPGGLLSGSVSVSWVDSFCIWPLTSGVPSQRRVARGADTGLAHRLA